jgi:hypothetical protein
LVKSSNNRSIASHHKTVTIRIWFVQFLQTENCSYARFVVSFSNEYQPNKPKTRGNCQNGIPINQNGHETDFKMHDRRAILWLQPFCAFHCFAPDTNVRVLINMSCGSTDTFNRSYDKFDDERTGLTNGSTPTTNTSISLHYISMLF